jgi:CHAD domain-containing protein
VNKRIESWMSSPARFAAVSLQARLTKLLEQLERCAAKPGADEVHDLRVSIRRFSQALRIFAPMLSARQVKAMRKALHPAMEAAGWVRDLDVGMDRLLDEGLEENNAVLEEMRAERRRGELALRGRLLLLKSIEPERTWQAGLRIQTASPKQQKGGGK